MTGAATAGYRPASERARSDPSRRSRRAPVAALALLGCAVSTYLALYQYHVLHTVWDPFFGNGSQKVLTSALSRALPVSDATLGAVGYAFEAIVEISGRQDRWRSQPWLVLLVGLTAAALGLTGIALVISQPILTGTFCTLCLASAAISVTVAALVAGEVRVALAEVRRRRARGAGWREALGRN
jgi:uncharacterized membrane protein